MVKVPSFDASKESGAPMPNYGIAKKPPVVVVRTGKPSPEIIQTKKEHLEAPNSENIAPDFQEVNPLNLNPPTNVGILEDVTIHQAESVEKKVSDVVFEDVISQKLESIEKKMSAEVFEEEIGEIDKGIKKYDSNSTLIPGFSAGIRKENYVDLLSINGSSAPSLSTHAPLFSSSSRIPLSKLPTSLNTHVHVEGTWKRLTRTGLGSDVGMAEAMGGKRKCRVFSKPN